MFNEIALEYRALKDTPRELKKFGIVMSVVFFVLSVLFWWKGREFMVAFIIGTLFLLAATAMPKVLKPFYKIWMGFGVVMKSITTKIVLGLVFFAAITPFALLAKIFGSKFLNLVFRKDLQSYWVAREKKVTPKDAEQQF